MISLNKCIESQRLYNPHAITTFCGKPIGDVFKMLRGGAVDVYYSYSDELIPVYEGETSIPKSGLSPNVPN